MIWFFLAGWISGAVFMLMYSTHCVHKHATEVRINLTNDERGHQDKDSPCNPEERILAEPCGDGNGENRVGPASEQRMDDKEQTGSNVRGEKDGRNNISI